MRIYVHTGFLSIENGAENPIKSFFDIAKLLGATADLGPDFGACFMDFPDFMRSTAEKLLVEAKLLYRVLGIHFDWQNALIDIRDLSLP